MGFLGFLGFAGFRYFVTGDPSDLSQFAAFAFFAYFWIGKLTVNIPDERYLSNVQQARAFVGSLAIIGMSTLFVLSVFFAGKRDLLVFGIAFVFASLIIGYAVKLYQLEEK